MGRRKRQKPFYKDLEITGIADKGKGFGRNEDGKIIFVKKVAVGDVVSAQVIKKRKDYSEAILKEIQSPSPDRIEPFCKHYGSCGGCQFQHVGYEAQKRYKATLVEDAMRRIAKVPIGEISPIIGCEQEKYYRNKLEFSFSCKRWLTADEINTDATNEEDVVGFHPPGAFDKVVDVEHCYLQNDPSNEIRDTVKAIAIEQNLPFWEARKSVGFIRQIMIRTTSTGDTMVILGVHDEDERLENLLAAIVERLPSITSLYYCINQKVNDFMLDLEMKLHHGEPQITEQLGHVKFKIGPKSFFQTNSSQAKVLYDVVADFAGLKGEENVYDLYTGLGSIAQYVAHRCKKVTGIEEIAAAIEDAKKNAKLNEIENCTFYAGDVKDILTEEFIEKHEKPDLIITDPPRAGMSKEVVATLLQSETPRIVYVSCNPATQARDLQLLHEKYDIEKVQPVDMFPHTHHIESVALLNLRHGKEEEGQ